jgi:chromosome segregation ATPase
MAQNNDRNRFLAEFQESLNRLSQLNNIVKKNTDNKRKFSSFVIGELEKIKQRIAAIVVKINELKSRLDDLQGQVVQNNNGIQSKDSEISQLKQQLDQLTREKDSLNMQLVEANRLRDENVNKAQGLQTVIDQKEVEIQNLTAQNSSLSNEVNALKQDLTSRGDVQAQHAQAIEQLRKENEAALNNQGQQNQVQIQQLQQQIAEKEQQLQTNIGQIQQLQQQIVEKDQQLQTNVGQIQQLQEQIALKDQEIARLQSDASNSSQTLNAELEQIKQELNNTKLALQNGQAEKAQLIAENDDLIERIKAATITINEATQHLRELTDEDFYNKSTTDVSELIAQIEQLLQNISNAIQTGQTSSQQVQVGPNRQTRMGQLNRDVMINGNPMNIENLLNQLKNKSDSEARNTGRKENKYTLANNYIKNYLDKNQNISNEDLNNMVRTALLTNGIGINNGSVRGGKKTHKKYKLRKSYNKTKRHVKKMNGRSYKQSGGFLYGSKKTSSTNSLTIPNSNSNKTPSTKTISVSSKTNSSSNKSQKPHTKNKNKNTSKKR